MRTCFSSVRRIARKVAPKPERAIASSMTYVCLPLIRSPGARRPSFASLIVVKEAWRSLRATATWAVLAPHASQNMDPAMSFSPHVEQDCIACLPHQQTSLLGLVFDGREIVRHGLARPDVV